MFLLRTSIKRKNTEIHIYSHVIVSALSLFYDEWNGGKECREKKMYILRTEHNNIVRDVVVKKEEKGKCTFFLRVISPSSLSCWRHKS